MQLLCAVARQKLNALPHDKIVGAQFLKSFIGSAVFIKSVLSEAEENRGGYWAQLMLRENNETETAVYDMLVDVQEKRHWLRRKTVPPAGLNMKVVKIINGCATADDYRSYVTSFGFPNRASNRAREASDQLFNAAAQIECMSIEFSERVWGEFKGFATTNFQVFPSALLRQANELISYRAHHVRIED
jgi:hypothetical protein